MPASVAVACSAVVVDIEGTTSAARHVLDVLFPYSRERIPDWLRASAADPDAAAIAAAVAQEAGCAPDDFDAVAAQLVAWIDADVKAAPLKAAQGRIWEAGFASGELASHLFDDVAPALRAWHAEGIALAVYSSGSVLAQRTWFRNAPGGDLTDLFVANFDLDTAGPKREAASYAAIALAMGLEPARLCFLSDIEAELEAAREAGWQAVGVRRPGEEQATASTSPVIASFAELEIVPV